jgi:hypothetical protein
MRRCIITAALALSLVACSDRMQQLESAGEKLKSTVNQCALAVAPLSTDKLKQACPVSGKEEAMHESIPGGGDRIQTMWNSRLNLW